MTERDRLIELLKQEPSISDNDLEWFRNQERAEYEQSKANAIEKE